MNAGKTRNKPGTDFRGEPPFVPWGGGARCVESSGLLMRQGLSAARRYRPVKLLFFTIRAPIQTASTEGSGIS
jgi:hypothetical protein